jgi:hypothetical protein
MSRYSVYEGSFSCHTCKIEVRSLRSYGEQKKLTWVCRNGHLTSVNLNTKKSKKDYERKI